MNGLIQGVGPACCSVHTHSACCDGANTLEEMAQGAFRRGVRYFGASGHSNTPVPDDRGNVLPPDPEAYRREVLRLREVYRGRMEVLLGVEQDSCSRQPVPDWAEYWIGSVHYLMDSRTGEYHAIDWDTERLRRGCEALAGGDYLALAERYFAEVAVMAARAPVILGHLDLITKWNGGGRAFFDEDAPRYRAAALGALHAADPQATLLEINTGGMARGYRDEPYPAQFLLREWRKMGGRIILTADAHTAGGILYAYEEAVRWARAAGFSRACLLTSEGPAECSLSEGSREDVSDDSF